MPGVLSTQSCILFNCWKKKENKIALMITMRSVSTLLQMYAPYICMRKQ